MAADKRNARRLSECARDPTSDSMVALVAPGRLHARQRPGLLPPGVCAEIVLRWEARHVGPMPKKDWTHLNETLDCCGHSAKRHIILAHGNRHTAGNYLCLSGFCKCGMVQVKPQGRRIIRKAKEAEDF